MSPMDHAAAHDRIEDLLLEPARLAALDASTDPDDVSLRAHVAECAGCRADLDGWRRLGRAISEALPVTPQAASGAVEPIEPPASLRARVIGAVHDEARAAAAAPVDLRERRTRSARLVRGGSWLGLAAAVVLVVGAASVALDQAARRASAEAEAAAMTQVVAAVDRVLASQHKVVSLQTADGTSAGSISWSRHDWVVLTTSLDRPSSEQRYKCWLEQPGRSVQVGQMTFAGGTAYWIASIDEWATWEIGPETQFLVTLEAVDAQARTGDPILSANLGS
jgi:hypothetical protein